MRQDALRQGPYEQGQEGELGLNCGVYLTGSRRDNGCLWSVKPACPDFLESLCSSAADG